MAPQESFSREKETRRGSLSWAFLLESQYLAGTGQRTVQTTHGTNSDSNTQHAWDPRSPPPQIGPNAKAGSKGNFVNSFWKFWKPQGMSGRCSTEMGEQWDSP